MHYVKHFDILGVETAQIPCIELQGVPNSATEGAVGLLGMDMTSEDKEVYICTAVNGAVYTWKSLKDGRDGVCVRKAEINDNGELIITLSDGVTLNAGVVKGEKGKDGADGEDGSDGKDGVGISNIEINTDGELVVSYTDGKSVNLGKVVGVDGTSISKIESGVASESNGYTITPINITKTDGSTITLELRVKNNIIELNTGVAMSFFIGTYDEWEAYTGNKTNVWFLPTDEEPPKLYQHIVHVNFDKTEYWDQGFTRAIISIINNDATKITTTSQLYDFLSQFGFYGYPVSGVMVGALDSLKGTARPLAKVFVDSDGNWGYKDTLYFVYADPEYDVTFDYQTDLKIGGAYVHTRNAYNLTITDTVIQLVG